MIYLEGQPIESIAVFSARFQAILSMIQGGADWLRWAMKDTSIPACSVSSENDLLQLIQTGLHSEEDIRFSTFRAALEKIFTMQTEDLEQLAAVRNTPNDNETSLMAILLRNNLYSYRQVNEGGVFTSSEIFVRPDLFKAPSFSDQLILAGFTEQESATEENLRNQALTFAQVNAATIPEFINLFFFYTYAAQNLLAENLSPQIQASEVQAYYKQLLPLTNYLLFTPSAGPGRSEKEIREGLQKMASSNAFIGYNNAAAAVNNLVRNINLQSETNLQTQIEQYLAVIRTLISSTPTPEGSVSQDGRLIRFRMENEQASATVGADAAGSIFLLPETKIKTN